MSWNVVINRPAQRAFKVLPKKDTERIAAALRSMQQDPFGGDVVALRGVHKGSFRRRIGSWRLLFDVDTETRTVSVNDILRRSSKTY